MLIGSQTATVDSKGRLKIPATFLPDLLKYGEEFFVTSESGVFARIYPLKKWEEMEVKMSQQASFNPTLQKFRTLTGYYGQLVKIDAQGRLLIPSMLRDKAQISGDVVVLANPQGLNVWNHARFLEKNVLSNPWTSEDDQNLGSLGI